MSLGKKPNIVIVMGSAQDAMRYQHLDKSSHQIVAINNAWRIRDDWDYLVYPEDFPLENQPIHLNDGQQMIIAKDFVPTQNTFGGFVYAGGTMAFTTGYWVLGALKPDVMIFIGCDMVYPTGGEKTHFYGHGVADPLRADVTLQSLEAKSQRLLAVAAKNHCLCLNLSEAPTSRLTFPRITFEQLNDLTYAEFESGLGIVQNQLDNQLINTALQTESDLGYFVESGRYWEHAHEFSPIHLANLDRLWMASHQRG